MPHGGSARWQDPVSLAALEECKQMEESPGMYKRFKNEEELFADLDNDDDAYSSCVGSVGDS